MKNWVSEEARNVWFIFGSQVCFFYIITNAKKTFLLAEKQIKQKASGI